MRMNLGLSSFEGKEDLILSGDEKDLNSSEDVKEFSYELISSSEDEENVTSSRDKEDVSSSRDVEESSLELIQRKERN